MKWTVLKLLTIVLPILFLVAVDVLRHTLFQQELHTLLGFTAVYGATAVLVAAFSWAVFDLVRRLESQILEQNSRLATLNRFAAASGENMQLQQLLDVALENVLETMRAENGVICSLDQEADELAAVCYRGFSEAMVQRLRRAKVSDLPIGGQVVRTGRPVAMERLFDDPRVAEVAQKEGIQAILSVPLRAQGDVTGVLAIATNSQRKFAPGEIEMLTSLGSQLGMAIKNSSLYEKAQRTNRELGSLLTVGRAVTSSLELRWLLDRATATVLDVTEAEAAEVWLVEGADLVRRAHRGDYAGAFAGQTRFEMGEGYPGIVAQTKAPLVSHDLIRDARFLRQEVKEAGFQTFCAWPLLHQGRCVGVLAVAARHPEAMTRPSELRLLEGIGEQLSVAIENALLHRQVQDAAVLEERERIAREMHDGLAQVLGYMNTQVLALRKLILNHKTETALEALAAMQKNVLQLYSDVREGLLGLRIAPGHAGGLPTALEEYIEGFGPMAGIDVSLEVSPEARELMLTSPAETQLVRIVQEALSNVRKHASATRAVVRLARVGDDLQVEVQDDGRGFDPASRSPTGWPRFGLQTMRERAESVGGKFSIESSLGQGSRIIVRVPVSRE